MALYRHVFHKVACAVGLPQEPLDPLHSFDNGPASTHFGLASIARSSSNHSASCFKLKSPQGSAIT